MTGQPRVTPAENEDDERYLLIDGRRWRRADPAIPVALRNELVGELMDARRAVGAARRNDDAQAVRMARRRVQDAKVALGERGRAWWLALDQEALAVRAAATARTLLRRRGTAASICPSDVARCLGPADGWREHMPLVREVARNLAVRGELRITRGEATLDPRGELGDPIRLRLA